MGNGKVMVTGVTFSVTLSAVAAKVQPFPAVKALSSAGWFWNAPWDFTKLVAARYTPSPETLYSVAALMLAKVVTVVPKPTALTAPWVS